MSTIKLSGSVGRGGTNYRKDVEIVQNLLNEYILAGSLGEISLLDEHFAGAGSDTEHAINEFQKRVMQVPATGLVRNATDELASLCKPPKESSVLDVVYHHIDLWQKNGPPRDSKIPHDLWKAALKSLSVHATHPRLVRYSMMTLVDFRLPRSTPRLWVVDLYTSYVHIYTKVAHGRGPEKNPAGDVPHNFGQPYSSRLGAYIALQRDHVKAGQKKPKSSGSDTGDDDENESDPKDTRPKGPAVRIQGLDESNRMAARIGILFHGAHYVKESSVGNSRGCFATSFNDNSRIVELIKGGSFAYAFAGE